ncbi:helix-turn-helix domain-containing protein [Salmonella enterica]|nr:helix-turn-helix domain-containing protein [Salmonella enterica]EKS4718513.1 helix-turn-helix domain-containing protein [Salmonella enterica]EKS4722048.1 helix-turn-helix domain-containing protein [Salmonella enterica]EKS4736263.1 helix-turn-helix domain-containing protein [Salmonella enterica]
MAKSSRDAAPLAGIMMMLFEQTSVTRSQLQEQFSVTERAIYRYLATLRDMGLIQLLEGETYVRTSAADLVIQSGLLRSFADFVDVSKFLPVGHGDFWRKLPARMDEKIISITGPVMIYSAIFPIWKKLSVNNAVAESPIKTSTAT